MQISADEPSSWAVTPSCTTSSSLDWWWKNGMCWQTCIPNSMLKCMPSTSVRIDRETHEQLKRLASELGTTVGEAVAIAARRLRQQRIGKELSTLLTRDEVDWLDADLR